MAMLMHGGVNYSGSSGSDVVTLTQAEYDLLPVETKMDPMKVFYITDATVTQQTIVPNPETSATEDLTKLQIDDTVYEVSGASSVSELTDVELTNLSDGEILKYDATEEKWVNSEVGSSDLDAVELTQSQYDALTPEQKSDTDKIYFLKDIENEAKFVRSPLFYSTSEAEVGVWTDGKPLYQITVSGKFSGTSFRYNTNISTMEVKHFYVTYTKTDAGDSEYKYVIDDPDYFKIKTIQAGEVQLTKNNASAYGSSNTVFVTILYTKSTDTPGSGKYSDLGVPAVHYSTTEKVIGTWIDGKPLYQKTWDFSSSPVILQYETWVNSGISANTNIKFIVSADLNYGTASNMAVEVAVGAGGYPVAFQRVENTDNTRGVSYCTLRYTKTTD